eukprot:3464346-Ditylum_brightwellii.AAC.1
MVVVIVVEQMVRLLEDEDDVTRGKACIHEGGSGKGSGVAFGGIEADFIDEELDIREVKGSGNDVCASKAVFSWTKEEEEGNPDEFQDGIVEGAAVAEVPIHVMEEAVLDWKVSDE